MEYIFFWGHHEKPGCATTKACFSQWYPASFEHEGVTYCCAEQFMMAAKARLFEDTQTLQQILSTCDPKEIKALGRAVKNFDPVKWDAVKYDVVITANMCKFGQNLQLWQCLHDTGDAILVEASPYDTIWGIGMKEQQAKVCSPEEWKGQNLLGKALMEVRNNLKAE